MNKLQSRRQFQAVLSGQVVSKTVHFALHRLKLGTEPRISASELRPTETALFESSGVWVGALVPKKWAKRAVTRNTIKRQIYNISEQASACLPSDAFVVRLRNVFDRKFFPSATSDPLRQAVRAEVTALMKAVEI